jgi:hypothetical protein
MEIALDDESFDQRVGQTSLPRFVPKHLLEDLAEPFVKP